MAKIHFRGWDGGLNKVKKPHLIEMNEVYKSDDMEYVQGQWQRRPGFDYPYTAISDGFSVTKLVDYVRRDQSANLVAGNKDGLWYLNGTTWTQRLNLSPTLTDKDKWFFAEINNSLYAVNKQAGEVYSRGDITTGNFAAITWDTSTNGAGETGVDIQAAGIVLAMNQRLWFFDVQTDVDGDITEQMRWTEVNDFDRSHTDNYINLVGSHTLIKSAGVLMNQLIAVYREDAVHVIANPGVPVAQIRMTYPDVGIVGPYAWTYIPGGGHFFVSHDGFYTFTGGQPQPIGDDKMTEYYLGLVSEANLDNVHCWTDLKKKQIHIGVPTGSTIPDKELVYNWRIGAWTEFNRESWCGLYRYRKQTSSLVFLGHDSGNVARVDTDNTGDDNGTAIATVWAPKVFTHLPANQLHESFDHPLITRIEHDMVEDSPGAIAVKIDTLDNGADTPDYTGQSYAVNEVTGWMDDVDMVPHAGHYIAVQVEGLTSITEMAYDITSSSTK